jgi:histidinol dehydrogenase
MPLQIRHLDSTAADFKQQLTTLLAFESETDDAIESAVARILADVKVRGDAAVLEYTERFDRLAAPRIPGGAAAGMAAFDLTQDELQQALAELPEAQRAALQTAADRIRVFHERQKQELNGFSYTEPDGTVLGQRVTPLDRVGIYVPGGKAAYPSSVLMNAIPAQVAGVKDIVMVVPTPSGVKNRMVLAAAAIAGVTRVITIGGAQAVAALAYGTETIPAVDKIVGPGNAYVAAAKRRVFGTVGIDMIAGPSEILVLCDGTTDPDWVAMDLFSQAEHDELAQAILLCPDAGYIAQVEASIHKLLPTMPRKDTITTSLSDRGALILVRDMEEACAIANDIAAEHLEISAAEPQQWADRIRHAGAMFLGRFSSESLGDYCCGPNHVLPTSRTARFSSPLGVYDFQKRSSVLFVSEAGAQTLGKVAAELAYGEGLQAHARSAELRLQPVRSKS